MPSNIWYFRIIQDQVRIVTMAIGTASDKNLENLAKWSNGQTYFIRDGKFGDKQDVKYLLNEK